VGVEFAEDRAALLADFGVACRITIAGGAPLPISAIVDTPTIEVSEVASEVAFLEFDQTALVRTEDVPGVSVEDVLEVLEGPYAGTFQVLRHERIDDGAFTRFGLGT